MESSLSIWTVKRLLCFLFHLISASKGGIKMWWIKELCYSGETEQNYCNGFIFFYGLACILELKAIDNYGFHASSLIYSQCRTRQSKLCMNWKELPYFLLVSIIDIVTSCSDHWAKYAQFSLLQILYWQGWTAPWKPTWGSFYPKCWDITTLTGG